MLKSKVVCKVCASDANYVYSIDNDVAGEWTLLDIFSCTRCKLLFVGTPLTEQQLADSYSRLDASAYYVQVGDTIRNKAVRSVEDLGPLLRGSNPSVLDVGCGYGHFLEAFRDSYRAVRLAGRELPGETAEACREKGFEVYTTELYEIPETFQAIVLLDVAEHVPDPNTTFAECQALLESNGHLYLHTPKRCLWDEFFLTLVKVPGLRRFARVWLRSRVSVFHLQLWTDEALRLSLEKAGLRVIYLKRELELSWPVEHYARIYLRSLPAPFVRLAVFAINFAFVRLKTLRNKAICLARKEDDQE